MVHVAVHTNPFNNILSAAYVEQWTSRDLAEPSLQVSVTSGDDVNAMRGYAVDKTIIGIRAFVSASKSLEVLVTSNLESKSILLRQLLQFCNHAVRDASAGRDMNANGRDDSSAAERSNHVLKSQSTLGQGCSPRDRMLYSAMENLHFNPSCQTI
jgi:hypothetical protein